MVTLMNTMTCLSPGAADPPKRIRRENGDPAGRPGGGGVAHPEAPVATVDEALLATSTTNQADWYHSDWLTPRKINHHVSNYPTGYERHSAFSTLRVSSTL